MQTLLLITILGTLLSTLGTLLTAKLSNGVVERGWGGGFAFVAAIVLCDGVDERVFMVKTKSKKLIRRF